MGQKKRKGGAAGACRGVMGYFFRKTFFVVAEGVGGELRCCKVTQHGKSWCMNPKKHKKQRKTIKYQEKRKEVKEFSL